MLREFFESIVKTHQSANTPRLLCEDARSKRYALADGTVIDVAVPPPPRCAEVLFLADLVRAIKWHCATNSPLGAVYVAADQIVYQIDQGDRRDVYMLALTETAAAQVLRSWSSSAVNYDQKAFLAVLQNQLGGCVEPSLVQAARRVESTYSGSGVSDVQHGRERGTREFQSELVGATGLPDSFRVITPLVEEIGLAAEVVALLTLTIPPQPVRFFPAVPVASLFAAERRLIEHIQAELVDELEDEIQAGLLIVAGRPGRQ